MVFTEVSQLRDQAIVAVNAAKGRAISFRLFLIVMSKAIEHRRLARRLGLLKNSVAECGLIQ